MSKWGTVLWILQVWNGNLTDPLQTGWVCHFVWVSIRFLQFKLPKAPHPSQRLYVLWEKGPYIIWIHKTFEATVQAKSIWKLYTFQYFGSCWKDRVLYLWQITFEIGSQKIFDVLVLKIHVYGQSLFHNWYNSCFSDNSCIC